QHLDPGKTPVGEQQLHPVKQHREGTDGQGEGRKPGPGPAQPHNRVIDDLLVAIPDGLAIPLYVRAYGVPPLVAGHRRLLGCIPFDCHHGMPLREPSCALPVRLSIVRVGRTDGMPVAGCVAAASGAAATAAPSPAWSSTRRASDIASLYWVFWNLTT